MKNDKQTNDLYKRQLGQILIANGDITQAQLDEALAEHKRT